MGALDELRLSHDLQFGEITAGVGVGEGLQKRAYVVRRFSFFRSGGFNAGPHALVVPSREDEGLGEVGGVVRCVFHKMGVQLVVA
jgi:hypothetical protein